MVKKEIREKQSERHRFLESIKEATDFERILFQVCENLKQFTDSTGVYFAIRDFKRKKITDNDDEFAHFSVETEVIRYIAWDKEHKTTLKGQFLELETGVTNDLFKPKEEVEESKENKENNAENTEEKKVEEEKLNFKLVPEVVREKRMKFFKEPKLGCYLAIDITYKSSLTKQVFKKFKFSH